MEEHLFVKLPLPVPLATASHSARGADCNHFATDDHEVAFSTHNNGVYFFIFNKVLPPISRNA